LKSVQRFQRRRFKCEKLTDGRRTLTHDKSSHGLWPGELKNKEQYTYFNQTCQKCSLDGPLPDCVFGADLKSNMAGRVHNVFSLAEILRIFMNISAKFGSNLFCGFRKKDENVKFP
jgi:hypothetical protein